MLHATSHILRTKLEKKNVEPFQIMGNCKYLMQGIKLHNMEKRLKD